MVEHLCWQALVGFHHSTKHASRPSPPPKLVKMTIRVVALAFDLSGRYYRRTAGLFCNSAVSKRRAIYHICTVQYRAKEIEYLCRDTDIELVQEKGSIFEVLQGRGVKSALFVLVQGYMEQYLQQCTKEANSSIYYTAYMKVICWYFKHPSHKPLRRVGKSSRTEPALCIRVKAALLKWITAMPTNVE